MLVFRVLLLLTLPVVANFAHALQSSTVNQPHIAVSLVSSVDTVLAGESFHLGLKLEPEDEWHVYWQNPGDSGMPVSISWNLPAKVEASPLLWPLPHKIPYGSLVNYGYSNNVVLPSNLKLDPTTTAKKLEIVAEANWLVCREECIPGSATLTLNLPLGPESKKSHEATEIQQYLQQVPEPMGLLSGVIKGGDNMVIELFAKSAVFKNTQKMEFFPGNEALFEASDEGKLFWKNNFLRITQKKSTSFLTMPGAIEGVLVLDNNKAWQFSFTNSD